MHAQAMVELAALVATHGRALIADSPRLSQTSLQDYWSFSKCRLDRWGRSLREYDREARQMGDVWALLEWPQVVPVLQEILTSDVLVRVWTAVVTAHDQRRGTQDSEPIVRSIFASHGEARNRLMHILLAGSPHAVAASSWPFLEDIQGLEQLRRRSERWTDLLIGYLLARDEVAQFAFDSARARDFAHGIVRQERAGTGREAWSLTLEALRGAFRDLPFPTSPNTDLNERIAASILACFESGTFESIGPFRSLWLTRLLSHTSDAVGMLDQLLELDERRRGKRGTQGEVS